MSKKISNSEAISIFNEIQTLRENAQSELFKQFATTNKENLKSAYPEEIIDWIYGDNEFSNIPPQKRAEAIRLLYSLDKENNRDKESKEHTTIYKFLKSCPDPSLVAIAEKMQLFQKETNRTLDERIAMASVILMQGSSVSQINVDNPYYYNKKKYSTKRELNEIKRRYQKVNAKALKNIRKYNKIHTATTIYDLYDQIHDFLTRNAPGQSEHYINNNVESIVYQNPQELEYFIYELKEQDFFKDAIKEAQGKSR